MAKRAKITRTRKKVTRQKRKRGRPRKYTNLESFSEKSIQFFLYKHFKDMNSKYLCRNKYLYSWKNVGWEVDFWHINNLGYHVEQEIKISKSDWNKEFKEKPVKHKFLLDTMESGGENLIEGELYCPNKFIMTCPEGLIDPEQVEELMPFAGLQWITDKGQVKTKINKYIHKRKMNMDEILLKKFYGIMSNYEYGAYMMLKELNKLGDSAEDGQYLQLIKNFMKETRI